ncbi:6-bladed beta-propeller [Perlabentimonas gracilis]|uniref:6-bladed beta-propeller n=1 Tax=Perlabentimonas gracilis TaxID=2715279 RepID=UPI001409D1EB|nr:6-bladed beta-propeller [Perlabentimonas gracilis]NHB69966.1 6-bladed beta-propeller [Perlabentimonas gracilis]
MDNIIRWLVKSYCRVSITQNLLLLFSSLILVASCKNTDYNNSAFEITMQDETNVIASDVFSGMKCIKLETRSDCVLAAIRDFEISKDLIYVLDVLRQGIYVFDLEGNFIKSLRKMGKGEGEYSAIEAFFVDEKSNTIEILDKNRMSIMKYSLSDFKYIDSIKLPFDFCFSFTKNDNLYYFQTNNAANSIGGSITNSEIIVFNATSKVAKPLTDKVMPSNENQNWEFLNIFTSNSKELFVSLAWHEYIYKIEEESLVPYININKGDRGIPKDFLKATYDEKMHYLHSNEMKGKSHFFKLLMNNENGLIIGYGIGYPPNLCYYMQLNNGKDIYFTDNVEIDFAPFTNQSLEIFKGTDKYISSVIYPHRLDDNNKLLNKLNVSSEDNPIVLLFNF